MIQANLGEFSALMTACLWVVSGVFFEKAGKRSGSQAVAYLRMIFAFFLICGMLWILRDNPLPTDASPSAWLWLSLSGLVGFVIGDLFLFEAYVRIGTRISLLLMSFSPVLTGVLGYLFFDEVLSPISVMGIFLTLAGIAVVVLTKGEQNRLHLRVDPYGVFCGIMGAVGQSLGTILSKQGMGTYDAFAATQIRIIAAIAGYSIFFLVGRHWQKLISLLKDVKATLFTAAGALFGTTLGVGFSLLAIQHTQTAIAAAIMSIMPVLIIPVNRILFKEKITWSEILGAGITVAGVVLLYLTPS